MPSRRQSLLFAVMFIVGLLLSSTVNAQYYSVLCDDCCGVCQSNVVVMEDEINLGCIVVGVSAFSSCRDQGGRFIGCLAEGFGEYLNCTGQARIRRRTARMNRRRLARQNRLLR